MERRRFVLSIRRALLAALLILSATSLAYAQLNQFTGSWKNIDPNTGGVTKLAIAYAGSNLTVHAWGKCHPTDCDWDAVPGYAYANGVQDNLAAKARAISAVYHTGFSETVMVIHTAAPNQLRAETMTRFTDNSTRTNYAAVETFARDATPPVTEDCVDFNPQTATVSRVNNSWKIVDGSHWMFDFGAKQNEANQSLALIKRYRMNHSCFVGRPDPSFQYMAVGNQAPQGAAPGEDCLAFNPANIAVSQINGSWKIVDGSHWMFDFGAKQNEANQAFQIIKQYGFTFSCFVGRPNASFQYLRR